MAPAKKVAANELAKMYLARSGSSMPKPTKTLEITGTKTIPPPTPNKPLRNPPSNPKIIRITIDEIPT